MTSGLDWTGLTLALGINSQFIFFRVFSKVSKLDLDMFCSYVVRVEVVLVLEPKGQGNLIE